MENRRLDDERIERMEEKIDKQSIDIANQSASIAEYGCVLSKIDRALFGEKELSNKGLIELTIENKDDITALKNFKRSIIAGALVISFCATALYNFVANYISYLTK